MCTTVCIIFMKTYKLILGLFKIILPFALRNEKIKHAVCFILHFLHPKNTQLYRSKNFALFFIKKRYRYISVQETEIIKIIRRPIFIIDIKQSRCQVSKMRSFVMHHKIRK